MRAIRALFFLFLPVAVAAHPAGGLIALDVNTVIFGDSMYNAVWRLEKGRKPQPLVKNFHAHWTTRGLDGHVYSESFQEMGGALFRIDPDGSQHIVDRSAGGWRVTAVATFGDSVFLLESSDSTNAGQRVRVIRGTGKVEILGQVEP